MEVGENLSEKGKRDWTIIQLAKKGNQVAYSELLNLYQEPVYYLLLKMIKNPHDAEDLTQEAFEKAFKCLGQYSPDYAFSTWLFKIASNNCIDFIRKKRVSTTSIDELRTNVEGESFKIDLKSKRLDPEASFIKQQKEDVMRKMVDKLKPRYRELVIKRYFEEKTYDEISTEMELPLGTVKAQLFRAREVLAGLIKGNEDAI